MDVSLSEWVYRLFDTPDRLAVFKSSISYLLQEKDSRDFPNDVRKYINNRDHKNIKKFRMMLKRNWYYVMQCRSFFYLVFRDISLGICPDIVEYGKAYNILWPDIINTKKAYILNDKNIVDHVGSGVLNSDIIYHDRILEPLQRILPDITLHCNRFVYKKMRFILNTYNMLNHDLVSELVMKAVEVYYWSILTSKNKSELHILNFIRRSCTNHGLNLIGYYTTCKRSRLIQRDNSQFDLVIVSRNQLHSMDVDIEQSIAPQYVDNVNLRLAVNSVVNKYKCDPKISILIRLLMGHKDEVFTRWLRIQNVLSKGDNTTIIDEIPQKKYIKLALQYLGISKYFADKIFSDVRTYIG